MKEAKKGKCVKCKEYFYVHEHHILPKSIFGKKGKTVKLCPNCHTHFHEYNKQNNINPEDVNETLKIWTTWLKVISLVVSMIVIGIILFV